MLILVNNFRLVIWLFKSPAYNPRQCKTVVIKVTGCDTIAESLVINKNLIELSYICFAFTIAAGINRLSADDPSAMGEV